MIDLNDYYLHPMAGKYIKPGIELLYYDMFSGIPAPIIVKVTKVKKFFGSVLSYDFEYIDDAGRKGFGAVLGGIDAVIEVVSLKEWEYITKLRYEQNQEESLDSSSVVID